MLAVPHAYPWPMQSLKKVIIIGLVITIYLNIIIYQVNKISMVIITLFQVYQEITKGASYIAVTIFPPNINNIDHPDGN